MEFVGDFVNFKFALFDQNVGGFQFTVQKVVAKSTAGGLSEQRRKIVVVVIGNLRQTVKIFKIVDIRVDVVHYTVAESFVFGCVFRKRRKAFFAEFTDDADDYVAYRI